MTEESTKNPIEVVELGLTNYDIAMMFSVLMLGRKSGDTQTYDWCDVTRQRLVELMDTNNERS